MNELTPEQVQALAVLQQILPELKGALAWVKARQSQLIPTPVDDQIRLAIGLGVFGTGTDTTPAGSVYVDTNRGKFKILHAGQI